MTRSTLAVWVLGAFVVLLAVPAVAAQPDSSTLVLLAGAMITAGVLVLTTDAQRHRSNSK